MQSYIGQQLGNYQLTRLLGQGGAAEVYLGEHIHLKTLAAIKILQVQMTPQDRRQFLSEAQIIANLKHANIVRMLDFGIENQSSLPYLVMEYAPNGTLRDRYPASPILLLTIILPYVKQVAAALQHIHDQKLVHRDVKPENMLLDQNDNILLSDFGIAVVDHSTRSRVLQDKVGTPYYMAPEQIRGQANIASDQYSLGIVVYEWLCGCYPFDGTADLEVLIKQINEPPPSLRSHAPNISDDVEWVVLKALAKDPLQRFASVQAFATALEQAGQSASASRSTHPSQTVPSKKVPSALVSYPAPSTQAWGGQQHVGKWGLGKRQVRAMLLGSALLSILIPLIFFAGDHMQGLFGAGGMFGMIASTIVPLCMLGCIAVTPLFFGAVFGPWVGLVVGGLGGLVGVYISNSAAPVGSLSASLILGNMLAGFISGFAWLKTQGYYTKKGAIAIAEGLGVLGIIAFIISPYILNPSFRFSELIPVGLVGVCSLIFLPILLAIYNGVVKP